MHRRREKPVYTKLLEWLRDFLIRNWPSFRDAYWASIAKQARGKTAFTARELLATLFTYGMYSISSTCTGKNFEGEE